MGDYFVCGPSPSRISQNDIIHIREIVILYRRDRKVLQFRKSTPRITETFSNRRTLRKAIERTSSRKILDLRTNLVLPRISITHSSLFFEEYSRKNCTVLKLSVRNCICGASVYSTNCIFTGAIFTYTPFCSPLMKNFVFSHEFVHRGSKSR